MDPKLVERYRSELEFLRKSGKEFSDEHPDEARRLGLPNLGTDPHVDRLLEGFALLTARIRGKIEDELPEVTDALLGVLYPHYTRPSPSMAVVRIDVPADQAATLRGGPEVPAHSPLRSQPRTNEPPCQFRTAYPVRLWPLSVGPAEVSSTTTEDAIDGARSMLSLPLRCFTGSIFSQFAATFGSLRLYLSGEGRSPFALRERMLQDLVRIEVRPRPGKPGPKPRSVILGPQHLIPVGFGPNDGLIPFPSRSFLGYRNLQEYFAFPQKFLFLDLEGLSPLRGWDQVEAAEIRFLFNRPLDPVGPDAIQLHCTPIVNLYEQPCQPIRLDQTRVEYPLEPESRQTRDVEIFSIEKVGEGNTEYRPFYHVARGARPTSPPSYWYTRRRPSIPRGSKRTHVALAFVDASLRPTPPEGRTISVTALCTDLDRPTRLPSGDLEARWTTAPGGPIRWMTPPTPAWPPPVGRDAQWRLVTHLALNHLPIGESTGAGTEALRALLRLHAPSLRSAMEEEASADDAARMQIEGIDQVSCRHVHDYVGRRVKVGGGWTTAGVVGGVETTIDFNAGKYARGPLLLAEVLEQFLGHYVSINAFSTTVARVAGKEVRRWRPRIGDKPLA